MLLELIKRTHARIACRRLGIRSVVRAGKNVEMLSTNIDDKKWLNVAEAVPSAMRDAVQFSMVPSTTAPASVEAERDPDTTKSETSVHTQDGETVNAKDRGRQHRSEGCILMLDVFPTETGEVKAMVNLALSVIHLYWSSLIAGPSVAPLHFTHLFPGISLVFSPLSYGTG
jgi:hypothetical protein